MTPVLARRRTAHLLLVPAGVLASHALGYLLAHPHAAERHQALGHHDHLSLLAVLAVLAAVAAVTAAILSGRAGRDVEVRLPSLAIAQALGFVALEFVEHAVSGAGLGGALGETGLWWGLGCQVMVAWAAVTLLRVGTAVGAALWCAPGLSTTSPPALVPALAVRFCDRRPLASPASRRGPP